MSEDKWRFQAGELWFVFSHENCLLSGSLHSCFRLPYSDELYISQTQQVQMNLLTFSSKPSSSTARPITAAVSYQLHKCQVWKSLFLKLMTQIQSISTTSWLYLKPSRFQPLLTPIHNHPQTTFHMDNCSHLPPSVWICGHCLDSLYSFQLVR